MTPRLSAQARSVKRSCDLGRFREREGATDVGILRSISYADITSQRLWLRPLPRPWRLQPAPAATRVRQSCNRPAPPEPLFPAARKDQALRTSPAGNSDRTFRPTDRIS